MERQLLYASETEHRPILVLFEYFERALQDLGLAAWGGLLRPGQEDVFRNLIKDRVYSMLPEDHRMQLTLDDPQEYLRWEPWDEPEKEILAHYQLQSGIVATLMGDRWGLKNLASLLITEPANRKLAIAYFLGNLSDGRVGLLYKGIPTKEQILNWVEKFSDIPLEDRLGQMSKLKLE